MISQAINLRILKAIFLIVLMVNLSLFPAYSQSFDCIKSKISGSNSLEIPMNKGGTNDDPTFDVTSAFTDLDISTDGKKISTCVVKNNTARIINLNPSTGASELLTRIETLNSNSGSVGALRGICAISPDGSQVFALGSGSDSDTLDRVYPFDISQSNLSRTLDDDGLNSFIPPDFATSLTVSPNKKFLVYTQNNASNNFLASIQSVEIKSNKTLSKAFVGQDLARSTQSGSFLEFAKGDSSADSKYAYGVFSNLQQGVGGSGTSFAIFKVDQKNGINQILGEFKKQPNIFSTPTFVGFSGLKLFKRGSEYYLFVSYFENDTNAGFGEFNYITKLAIFNVDFEADKALLALAAKPTVTVFKSIPCKENLFHGIAGPVWVSENKLFIADNLSGENYFASYRIDWSKLGGNTNSEALTLTSAPLVTSNEKSQLNTDIVGTLNGRYIYVAIGDTSSSLNSRLFSYTIDDSFLDCSTVVKSLGLCDLTILTLDTGSMGGSGSSGTMTSSSSTSSTTSSSTSGDITQINPIPIPPPNIQPNIPSSPPSGISSFPGSTNISSQPTSNTSNPISNSGRPSSAFGPVVKKPKPSPTPRSKPSKPSPDVSQPQPTPPPVDLIPMGETTVLSSDVNQALDVKSLNLQGSDQMFNIPTVPNLVFSSVELPVIEDVNSPIPVQVSISPTPSPSIVKPTSQELPVDFCCSCKTGSLKCDSDTQALCDGEVKCVGPMNKVLACCKKIKGIEQCNGSDISLRCLASKVLTKDKKVIAYQVMSTPVVSIATETTAFLKGGSAGVLINLKKGITLKAKDTKNIIQAYIDDKTSSSYILPSVNTLSTNGVILSKITIPENIKSSTGLLVTLLNKGGGKKEVIAKSKVTILDTYEFKNIGEDDIKGLPVITKISGRLAGSSSKGGSLVRITLEGNNFASRSIISGNYIFNASKSKALTVISFTDNKNIEIIRTRVLNKGRKVLLTIRYTGSDDISTRSLTVSTPKGQVYFEKLGLKLFNGKSVRSILLDKIKQ